MTYDCIIVGGGIAGLQAAIQLGRYSHNVLVIDASHGRSVLCRNYHNILGWPDGVSGEELRRLGRQQAERYGIRFQDDLIVQAERSGEDFRLEGRSGATYSGRKLLLATGVMDRFPELPGLVPCLGMTLYICPDCDGYEIRDRHTLVLGSGEPGARMALLLADDARSLVYINHEREALMEETAAKLERHGIRRLDEPIAEVLTEGDGLLTGVRLKSGEVVKAERGFLSFGGNEVRSDLAKQLGVERLENKHIVCDPRSRKTNVPGVWAAGDVGVHAEQVTIAMGDGTTAAIWIHKELVQE
ncbi:oxidoreductase [Paenibacillus sp. J31TS4]|uniref:NAD(P)/FAD-dependent oxidoreductase n=1 Tax=Paenibacillus sp. J31TS4 TaxID=2807195 RepID=UPI001B194621|nr:NAD(P)/FAD-dependent oxidoreductase [Paenibacillus sp. J31TS4]GIP38662.1 oxidoreductase [Paenibacillus sp. J31TS4]